MRGAAREPHLKAEDKLFVQSHVEYTHDYKFTMKHMKWNDMYFFSSIHLASLTPIMIIM